ncbi:MAG: hypothetical protein RIT19_1006, partial [Verrucomicrobiota bacterium]
MKPLNLSVPARAIVPGTTATALLRSCVLLVVLVGCLRLTAAEPATPRKGLVATVNPVATEAG